MTISLKRIELILWMLAPASITFLLFILYITPKHLWGISYVMPVLPLIPIFYWGRFQALEIPYWFVFLIGLLMDSVSGTPLGLSSILYIFLLIILHAQNKSIHKKSFMIVWGCFAVIIGIVFILQWIAMSIFNNHLNSIPPVIIQYILTVSLYPIFHKLFNRLAEYINHRCCILGFPTTYL